MSQATLAEILYLSVDSISNIENGKQTCMPEYITKICQIFNISADYFYFHMDKPLMNKNQSELDSIKGMLDKCSEFDLSRVHQMMKILLAQPSV